MKLSIALPAIAAAALLTLAGCSIPAEKAATPADSPAATSQAATAAPSAPAKPKKNDSLIVKFGETITYADGLAVTVKHVGTAVASAYAAPEIARGAEVQLFEITLTNGTAGTFEPTIFTESAVYGKAGAKAEKVFDSGNNMSAGYFSGVMVPGASQTIVTPLLIPAAELATTVFSIRPSFEHKASAVTGGL